MEVVSGKYPQLAIDADKTTVEPVLSGTILNGHPLLSRQLWKSPKLLPLRSTVLTIVFDLY